MLVILLLGSLELTPVYAQQSTGADAFKKLFLGYQRAEKYIVKAQYTYYPSHKSTKPEETFKFLLFKSGEVLYLQSDVIELFYKDHQQLTLNHADKEIYYQEVASSSVPVPLLEGIHEIVSNEKMQFTLKKINEALHELVITSPGVSNTVLKISYDPVEWFVKEFDLLVDIGEDAEVGFDHELNGKRIHARFEKAEHLYKEFSALSLAHFGSVKQGVFKPSKKFNNYVAYID
jgi:hypothetical protein